MINVLLLLVKELHIFYNEKKYATQLNKGNLNKTGWDHDLQILFYLLNSLYTSDIEREIKSDQYDFRIIKVILKGKAKS